MHPHALTNRLPVLHTLSIEYKQFLSKYVKVSPMSPVPGGSSSSTTTLASVPEMAKSASAPVVPRLALQTEFPPLAADEEILALIREV